MSYNYAAIIVGLPGAGKTTLQMQLIERHLRDTKGIVLAHDPMHQFTGVRCAYYKDVASYRRAAADAGREEKTIARGASIGGIDSDGIVQLALQIGERRNTAKNVALPILVPFDEGSLREGSGSTYISKLDNELLAVRRHRGVAPVFNLQEVKQLTARFYRMSTDVYLFRQPEDRAHELDTLLFLAKGTLARAGVSRLEQHRYLHVRIAGGTSGVVSDPL